MSSVEDELQRVYADRYRSFARGLLSISGSSEAAADAVQEAFAKALQSRDAYRGGSVEAWVWTIAIRTARRTARRATTRLPTPTLDGLAPTEEIPDVELRAAVASLPEQRRLTVFLRYWAGLSYTEIAELRGVSEGTVGATLAKAHADLRRSLEKEAAT